MSNNFSDVSLLEKHSLYTAYNVLIHLGYGRAGTLTGAFALYMELGKYVDLNSVPHRQTKDLDFNMFANTYRDEDYLNFSIAFTEALGHGFKVDFKPPVKREDSVTYKFKVSYNGVETSLLKIDLNFYGGKKVFDVVPLMYSFASKISLSASMPDRRAKDKVDMFTIIYYLFGDGVSKGYIFNILKEFNFDFNLDVAWVDNNLYEEKVKRSAKGFKPKTPLKNLSIDDILKHSRVFLIGLASDKIPVNYVYRGGMWFDS